MNKNNDPIIELKNVTRRFGPANVALDDFTISVPRGCVYGFLGRNAAGKTTAIKTIAGLLKPDCGAISVLGKNPFDFTPEDRQRVGYMSEKQILPANYKVKALIEFCAPFYPKWNHELVKQLLDRFRISGDRKIKELSQGTQRQVAFILALAQRPELLILDEPAATLDVIARREFLDEILNLLRDANGETTVFISSHILSDIERIADHIGIIANGELVISEPLDDLAESIKKIRFHSFVQMPENFSYPKAYRIVKSKDEILVTARISDPQQLKQFALQLGANYEVQNLNLEDIFYEVSTR